MVSAFGMHGNISRYRKNVSTGIVIRNMRRSDGGGPVVVKGSDDYVNVI